MPSVIISSSEESESEAFSIEKQSDESMSQSVVESDSEEVFVSEDDEKPQKGKKAKKSTQQVTVKQENAPRKRNAPDLIKVKEENESGATKRKRVSVKQEPTKASSANTGAKKGGRTKKDPKSPTESDIPDERSTQENAENASGSENEYSEEDEDITEFKPGQLRPTPSPGYGDRVFYESLFEQNPKSFMALKWCVEHGVFSAKKSEMMLKELLIRKEEMKKNKKGVSS